jgi:hypothetical protein
MSVPQNNTLEVDKELPNVATQGMLSSDVSQMSVPVEPYSIYSKNEKWFIVGVVAIAGFYRHVLKTKRKKNPYGWPMHPSELHNSNCL